MSLQSKINKIKIAPHGGCSHAVTKLGLDNVFWLRGWREVLNYTKENYGHIQDRRIG